MVRGSVDANFLFTLGELHRLIRWYADKEAGRFGITRAQWAVLAKVERSEGMKQTELAELLEMQPITLTRLIDKLCQAGWIERRSDAADRRVNRLYLRKTGRALLGMELQRIGLVADPECLIGERLARGEVHGARRQGEPGVDGDAFPVDDDDARDRPSLAQNLVDEDDDRRPEAGADHPAAATEDRRPADDDSRDHRELPGDAVERGDPLVLCGRQERRKGRAQ